MKPDLTTYLGRIVVVRVYKPLGSRHPRHPDMTYPVTYGEVPGTLSGDGKPIDAYLLGSDAPVAEAEGRVVAVVVRDHNDEDKLVVTMGGAALSQEAIWQAVSFPERYFESRLIMAASPRGTAV